MPRYALKVEYNGAPFAGWQRQKDLPTVQGGIEAALGRLEPGPHTIAAAGRTDTGVHATGQVAHCDLARDWEPFRLSEALNWHLKPAPVAIVACARVDEDFHARFSAIGRRYLFRLITRRAPLVHDAGRGGLNTPGPQGKISAIGNHMHMPVTGPRGQQCLWPGEHWWRRGRNGKIVIHLGSFLKSNFV